LDSILLRLCLFSLLVAGVEGRQASARVAELFGQGQRHEAVALLEQEVVAEPGDRALRGQLVQCLMSLRRYRRALEVMRPGAGEEARGRALFFLGRYEDALEHLAPSNGDEVLMVVDALEALGRLEERDRVIDRAREVRGEEDAAVLVLRGRRAAWRGRHAEAAAHFQRALEEDPVLPEALFGLGHSLVRSGQLEKGRAVLQRHREVLPLLDRLEFAERSLQLNPAHAPNRAALADVLRELGRLDEAGRYYRSACEGAQEEELVPIVLRHARFQLENREDLEAALRLLRAAAERVRDPRLAVREGDWLAAAGRGSEAAEAYRRALAILPEDVRIQERLRRLESGD